MKSIIKSKKLVAIALIIGIISVIGFTKEKDFKISKSLDIYYTLFRELNLFYVDETNPEDLVETSIESMLESLDPYTKYIPEEDMKDFEFMTTGNYGGIGALIQREDEYAIVSQPYKGFPADKAGLKTADKILEIDGQSIKGWELEKISDNLKGVPETKVELVIDRPGKEEPIKKEVIRKKVHINSVPYYSIIDKDQGTGYIRLSKFTEGCSEEVRNAFLDLEKNNELNKIILDLRSNPGGLLEEAVKVANLFVPKGDTIVSTKGKVDKWNQTYKTESNPENTDIPLVILVDRASASASEIVAGAIQDLDRGVIIGERTFGKGLVQTTRPLSYNGKLKVTTAKYYIPSGRSIQAKDYSNRNEDGSVGEIPDSLINDFQTANGRKVYDGGGIRPDLEEKSTTLSRIEQTLLSNRLVFDYVTNFTLKHDSIPPVPEYNVSENTFEDFKNFIDEKEWDYSTRSEEKLEKLIETAKEEKYYKRAKSSIDDLKSKLSNNKEKDLEEFKSSIKQLMKEEIASRYYYQAGSIQANLEDDKQVDEAIETLENINRYNKILSGEVTRDNVKTVEEKKEN
ncbi:MAG: S41 family peptidase [Bacteroidota bacterium]